MVAEMFGSLYSIAVGVSEKKKNNNIEYPTTQVCKELDGVFVHWYKSATTPMLFN